MSIDKETKKETVVEGKTEPKGKKESVFKTTVEKVTKSVMKKDDKPKDSKPQKPVQEKAPKPVKEKPQKPVKEKPQKPVKEKPQKPVKEKPQKPTKEEKKAIEDKKAQEKTEKAQKKKEAKLAAEKKAAEKKAEKKPAEAKEPKPKKEKPEKVSKKKPEKPAKVAKEKNEKKPAEKSVKKSAPKAEKKPEAKGEKKKNNEKWSIKNIGGYLFAKMLRGGASELHANAEEVNKLNVFPVPDGDTGDNMTMTIESGVASLENIDTDDLAEVLRVASRGMLLGARGNSGVILSQFFAGMAKGLENVETADAKKLAHALELGVEQAYKSVMTPTEGTILTVAREAVEYAVSRLTPKSTVQSLFSDLVNEMNASLQRTPEILPILGEAGVVDSGGAGLLYIIDGLNRVLNGEDIEDTEESLLPSSKSVPAPNASFGPDSVMEYGYCTELLVQLMNRKTEEYPFDLDALKLYLASYGDSIVAFQTESIVKIHVHTLRPDKIIRYMLKRGDFISVKVENMSLQHTELTSGEDDTEKAEPVEEAKPKKKYGIVAVSNGEGISDLFRQLGTDEVVQGGQTNNPSTNDFIDAFDNINAENIFVFPNNGNIIMAAGQAAEIYEKAKVYVVPTKSIGAGYVAMSTMSFDVSEPDTLMAEAEDAIGRITSAYVSPAVRDADMNGVHVTEGDTMGIIAKEIVISGPDKMVSTYGLIDILLADTGRYMITVFHGKDATTEERDQLAEYMLKTYPMVEAYFVDGGQEIYPFLFVAE